MWNLLPQLRTAVILHGEALGRTTTPGQVNCLNNWEYQHPPVVFVGVCKRSCCDDYAFGSMNDILACPRLHIVVSSLAGDISSHSCCCCFCMTNSYVTRLICKFCAFPRRSIIDRVQACFFVALVGFPGPIWLSLAPSSLTDIEALNAGKLQ